MVVYRRSSRRRSVLVLLVLTAITLITLDERGQGTGVIATARHGAHDLVAPLQSAADDVFTPVGEWFDGVVHESDLSRENKRLRRELTQARGQAARGRDARRENDELKKLAQLPYLAGVPSVAAEIVSGSPGNFESTVTLDKGTTSGITKGEPVVAGDGLVGRVIDASRRRATVLLLTDPAAGVGVRLEQRAAPGVATGQVGSALLTLTALDADVPVAKGELAVTAGLQDAAYPAGIPVARVDSVRKAAGEVGRTILLRPLVDTSRVEFVRVLRWPGG